MDTMTKSSIRKIVLRRARFIHVVRPLLSGTLFGALAAILALYFLGREVWVARVFENMPSLMDVAALTMFLERAFLNTSFAVQVLTVVLVAGVIWAARDTAHSIKLATRFA